MTPLESSGCKDPHNTNSCPAASIERPRIRIREIHFLILLLSFETSNLPRIPYETSFSFVRTIHTAIFDVLTGQLFLFPHHLPCNLNFLSLPLSLFRIYKKQRFPIFRSVRLGIIITINFETDRVE